VNKVLFVKNLPFKITTEELYDLFGKYGAIQQIRMYALPHGHRQFLSYPSSI
jgi:RNA recognition motif-containing protein